MHKNFKPKRVVWLPAVEFTNPQKQTVGTLTGPERPHALIVPKEAR